MKIAWHFTFVRTQMKTFDAFFTCVLNAHVVFTFKRGFVRIPSAGERNFQPKRVRLTWLWQTDRLEKLNREEL